MLKKKTLKWLIPLSIFCGTLYTSCSEHTSVDLPDPELETIAVKDVTDDAQLRVSIENPDGATGQEGSNKLIDGDTTTKYLAKDFKSLNIDFQFDTAKLIASYEFTTGNDFDGRDPMDWKFYGSDDGQNWTELDSHMGMQFRKRRTTYKFYFKNEQQFTYYRWSISKLYNDNMFQASEFRLIQMPPSSQKDAPREKIDSLSKNGVSLVFINHSDKSELAYQERLMNTYFSVYPKLIADFNPDAKKKLYFIIDPTYEGAAYAFGDVVVFSYDYMEGNPTDGDVVVHETMHHIQQGYQGNVPGWLVEGIADNVRYHYGIDDPDSWTLQDYKPEHNFDGSYGITARFLLWIETHKNENFVKELDRALRNGINYNDFFRQSLGKSIEDTWSEYAQNPAL